MARTKGNGQMIPIIRESLLKARSGSLRGFAVALGFGPEFAPVLSDMLSSKPERQAHVSAEAWSRVSVALGLPALAGHCPDCGRDHVHGRQVRCHGRPVTDVVCLGSGERVAKVRGLPIPRRLSDYPPPVLAWLLTNREPMTAQEVTR